MKVWVLFQGDYEQRRIDDVFASEELMMEAIKLRGIDPDRADYEEHDVFTTCEEWVADQVAAFQRWERSGERPSWAKSDSDYYTWDRWWGAPDPRGGAA